MSGRELEFWQDKLLGKIVLQDDKVTTLAEDEYVRIKDLPKPNRVLSPGSMATRDYREERLNVHVDDDMRVTGLNYG
ncbi:hypothetical protein RO3G_05096 [Rhizopus delemar RA 99-880]|uniref:Uncharacterized protein n=1 Tax=Rhizopus delemar (strain RA 99-880 / ATCC MYA-4621 / FGSC 9543 / NRRL 43880) TaxID=246409 RepID=I1BW11_RHIO9|nr:hypothetical protein RO3G_05096 [Rhizopus delemar RA 99-880]|eukprot:EIE80391.1 hypothetical protein RO3G_05096 [Rhizopus delemar RA 99-880]